MKQLTTNNTNQTYYYPINNNKFKKYLLLLILAIFSTILIYFIWGKKNTIENDVDNFTFNDISAFKDCKQRHIDYYNEILHSNSDVLKKTNQRKTVDSLYLLKTIELLESNRKEIFNSNFTYSNKLENLNRIFESYNLNRLVVENPINLTTKLREELDIYNNDLKFYQNEIIWSKRIIEVEREIMNHLDDNAVAKYGPVYDNDVQSQDIQAIDSLIESNSDERKITYTYYIEREYKTRTGLWKYSGTGKWEVLLNIKNGSGIQVNLIEPHFTDVIKN
jgi:hypothetical protein